MNDAEIAQIMPEWATWPKSKMDDTRFPRVSAVEYGLHQERGRADKTGLFQAKWAMSSFKSD
jgi:hypothetical protein